MNAAAQEVCQLPAYCKIFRKKQQAVRKRSQRLADRGEPHFLPQFQQ